MKHSLSLRKTGMLLAMLFLCLSLTGALTTVKAASRTTLLVGQTKQLKKQGAAGWKSSRPSVATVSASGLVTALKKGSTTVTAVRGGRKLTWNITVLSPVLSASQKNVDVGKKFTLSLKRASGLRFSWSVSDPSILKLKKKNNYKYKVTGLRNGTADVIVSNGSWQAVCTVIVGTGITDEQQAAQNQNQPAAAKPSDPSNIVLYMDGNIFKEMTHSRSDTAIYISSLSRYGQSAPLYIHKDGGDGLENIWAATNNGAVGVAGAQLSADAVQGTILKACTWARAICDSPYHGYDYGHDYAGASLMYTFGQAKPNALGTGDTAAPPSRCAPIISPASM